MKQQNSQIPFQLLLVNSLKFDFNILVDCCLKGCSEAFGRRNDSIGITSKYNNNFGLEVKQTFDTTEQKFF